MKPLRIASLLLLAAALPLTACHKQEPAPSASDTRATNATSGTTVTTDPTGTGTSGTTATTGSAKSGTY
jgi:hypothetical protein